MSIDAKWAAETLLEITPLNWPVEATEALSSGAQALEAWAWVERMGVSPTPHGSEWFVMGHTPKSGYVDGIGSTPLAAVLDAMEKDGR